MSKRKKKISNIFVEEDKPDFRVIKTSLKSILKEYQTNHPLLNKWVHECNDIAITVYQFIRLYILDCYHTNKEIPELTEELLSYFVRACGIKQKKGTIKHQDFQNELDEFYDKEFKPCLQKKKFSLFNKKFMLNYLIIQIHIAFYNNLKEHFVTRFRRFINLTIPIELKDDKNRNIKENIKLANSVKSLLLLNKDTIDLPEELKEYVIWVKSKFLPNGEVSEKGHGYDVKVSPHKYLYFTIKMNEHLENLNNKKIKLFQPIPLRTQIIPKYITLDACVILNILGIGTTKYLKDHPIVIKENQELGNANRLDIWSYLFHVNKKVMNIKGYLFKTIQTDGVGVSICFQKIGKHKSKATTKKDKKQSEMYITDLTRSEIDICQKKTLLGIDPGKSNLVYIINETKNTLRYTAPQRRKESYSKKYCNIISSKKFHNGIIQTETTLSNFNSKTVDYERYKEYLSAKIKMNDDVKEFYQDLKLRKFKWRVWIYQRKSEDVFFNKIEKTYGKDLLLCYGNWSTTKQMKYIMPTRGIGLRRRLSKKYKTLLVDEFNTSVICNQCKSKLSNFKKDGEKVHRVLVCNECKSGSSDSKTSTFINRDINGSLNILEISKQWILNQTRPIAFERNQTCTLTG